MLCSVNLDFFLMWLDLGYCIGGETHYQGFQNTCHLPGQDSGFGTDSRESVLILGK